MGLPLFDGGLQLARHCGNLGHSPPLLGTTAAWIAALALALQPALVEWDRLYRMYAVLVALGAVSWWLLVRAGDARGRGRWLWWTLYGCSAVTLPYVHYVGALVVLSQGLYVLTRLRTMWPALVGEVAAALALIHGCGRFGFIPHGGLVIAMNSLAFSWPHVIRASLAYGIPAQWVIRPDFDLFFSIVAMVLLLAGIYAARASVVPFWLFPVVIQVVASLTTGKDLVIPRYLYVYVPAFCIGFGALCAALAATKYRVTVAALAAAYFGVAAVSIPNMLFVPLYQFPDWYQVNTLLLANEHKYDLIVLDQGAEYWVVYQFSGFSRHQIDAPALPTDLPLTMRWLDGYPNRRVWYIENQPGFTDQIEPSNAIWMRCGDPCACGGKTESSPRMSCGLFFTVRGLWMVVRKGSSRPHLHKQPRSIATRLDEGGFAPTR